MRNQISVKPFFGWISLVLIFLTPMFFILGILARDRALADADRTLATRAQIIADSIDRALQQRMIQVFTLAALPSMRGFAAGDAEGRDARKIVASSELRAIAVADPNVRAASIVDEFGRVILTTDASLNVFWGNRLFVRDALTGRLHASVTASEFNEFSQYYSAPILDNFGEVAGALILRVAVQEMWSALGGQADVMLIDEYGVRVADRSAKPSLHSALTPLPGDIAARVFAENRYGAQVAFIGSANLVDLANAIKQVDPAPVSYRDATGQSFRAAWRRLKTNPWTVICFASEDEIFATANDMILDQIKVAVFTLIIVGGLALAARYLVRPRETST